MSTDYFVETLGDRNGKLRVGGYIILKGFPCKIGGLGNCLMRKPMYHVVGIDIFTGKKYEDFVRGNFKVPIITYEKCMLINIGDNITTVLNETGDTKEVEFVNNELKKEVEELFLDNKVINVIITSSMGICMITSYSVDKSTLDQS